MIVPCITPRQYKVLTEMEEEEPMENTKIVPCSEGLLRGKTDGKTAVFLGVPFAAPPTGPLRLKGPQPPYPWMGVRDALIPPPMPVQLVRPGSPLAEHEMSEDYLYLNIWAPDSPAEPCPVLVWFYGGALQNGNADSPMYDGAAYNRDGVIVVTVGYRVGVLGFLCHPDMQTEDPNGFVGNFGHRDQLAALQWIQKNIAAFGGDPNRVTISGQSAGSGSCCTLMNAPAAAGSFQRAICHSGDIFQPERDVPLEQAETWGIKLLESFGCKTLDEFRKIPVTELYREGDPMMKRVGQLCAAVIDGAFLPGPQGERMLQNNCMQVPIIVGSNLDEGSRWVAEQYFPTITKRLGIPEDLYADLEDLNQRANALARDYWYGRTLAWAKIRSSEYGLPTWQYVFGRRLSPMGAFHGMEIPYTFETLNIEPEFGRRLPYTEEDQALSRLMHSYWVNFIKNGDPNGPDSSGAPLPYWPSKAEAPGHMRFDAVSGMHGDVIRTTDAVTSPAVEAWMRGRM